MERSDDEEGCSWKDHSSQTLTDEDPGFVEVDPTGRYGRYSEVLGKGAYKTVYKAFDELDGIEVAWNQVNILDTLHKKGDMERLYSELHLLKMLKHENIIKFCSSWVDARSKNVNFITEIFTSGTLRQYRKKHKHVKMKAIKHWSRQILQGLVYLHSHDPPIIHRDLKCDNIFINGNSGEVKIGDLGLAVILSQAPAAHSVIGTPEFMAPELYEEHYNELVDIYSFGMCLLEIVTFEYPYSECTNAAQIYKKVTSGKRPAALNKVKDMEMRKFVEKCLASASERLHAKELLKDPFLQIRDGQHEAVDACQSVSLDPYDDMRDLYPALTESPLQDGGVTGSDCNQKKLSEGAAAAATTPSAIELESPRGKVGWKRSRDFRIKVKQQDGKKVLVRFRITSSGGGVRYIQFDFDIETDAAMEVAFEMVNELDLSVQDVTIIAAMLDAELTSLLPDWRPGCDVEDAGGDEQQQELILEALEARGLEADDLAPLSLALGPADDSKIAPPDSRNDVLVYGRFEEVGCNLVGSHHTQQDVDGLGSFSDFSSEHLEGGGSDLSLDASSDRLIAEKAGGSDLSFDVGLTVEGGSDEMLSMENTEGANPDVRTDFPLLVRESFLLTRENSLTEYAYTGGPCHKPDTDVGPRSLEYVGEVSALMRTLGSTPSQPAMDMDKLNKHGSFIISDAPKYPKLNKSRSMGTNTQPHSIPKCEEESHDGDASEDSRRICAAAVSSTEPRSRGVPGVDRVKREQVLSTKRESYLEFYKAGVSQKDKAVPAKSDVAISVCKPDNSKDDDREQVRKLLLQKSIANLEAKTLEGLSQSSSSYMVKSASKSNTAANVHSHVHPH